MASDCEIRIAGCTQAVAALHAEAAVAEVQRIEAKFSRYRADSVVSRINMAAGSNEFTHVDDETAQLLGFAAQLHTQSDGLFDITSGVLRRVWDFRAGRVPTAEAIRSLLPQIGWQHVEFDANARRVRLPRAGMELDFGGFGKEYAADRAGALLASRGVRAGLVNLGGDLHVIGPRPDGSPWSIGIQHPRDPAATIASIALARGALATSGDYERFFVHDGRRYCHILDPRSGWPVTRWQSVSVIAPLCVAAGALSTIAMLKQDGALAFLASQQVAYLVIDADGTLLRRGLPGTQAR